MVRTYVGVLFVVTTTCNMPTSRQNGCTLNVRTRGNGAQIFPLAASFVSACVSPKTPLLSCLPLTATGPVWSHKRI